jgi:hypothetical protein
VELRAQRRCCHDITSSGSFESIIVDDIYHG